MSKIDTVVSGAFSAPVSSSQPSAFLAGAGAVYSVAAEDSQTRPSVEITPEKIELVEWVADFLCHWQESGILFRDGAEALVDALSRAEGGDQNLQLPQQEAQALIQALKNRLDQT